MLPWPMDGGAWGAAMADGWWSLVRKMMSRAHLVVMVMNSDAFGGEEEDE